MRIELRGIILMAAGIVMAGALVASGTLTWHGAVQLVAGGFIIGMLLKMYEDREKKR